MKGKFIYYWKELEQKEDNCYLNIRTNIVQVLILWHIHETSKFLLSHVVAAIAASSGYFLVNKIFFFFSKISLSCYCLTGKNHILNQEDFHMVENILLQSGDSFHNVKHVLLESLTIKIKCFAVTHESAY